MPFWKRSVLEVGLIGCLVLCGGQVYASEEAQVDSLVSYVELLERDLAQCEIMAAATEDTLRHRLEWALWDLDMSKDREMRWYEKPTLWFLFGAAAMALIYGATINVTF